jgi:hypothetical protein
VIRNGGGTAKVSQADWSSRPGRLHLAAEPVDLANSASPLAKSIEPTALVGLADSPVSSSPSHSDVQVLCTFIPHRPEVGTWKSNEKKNQEELVVGPPCTFDRLMAKYK